MKLINKLVDIEYEFKGVTHTRNIARGIVFNDNKEIALCHIIRDDIFGHSEYYETPGGGVDEGETPLEAVVREIDEELGYKVEVIDELGLVDDYYNLLYRHNLNNYFLCHTVEKTKVHLVSEGDKLISEIKWMSIEEAINAYASLKDTGLEGILKRRELPVLLIVNDMINDITLRRSN